MKTDEEILFGNTMGELISLIEEFTPSELNEIPFPGSWTAGQVGDHLYKSYAVVKTLYGNVVPSQRSIDQKIPAVKELFLDPGINMTSPEAILPSTEFIDKEKLLENLKERIAKISNLIKEEDLTLLCTDYAIPEYGSFTRMEWIYFTIYHTSRHIQQIKRIKEMISARDYSRINPIH